MAREEDLRDGIEQSKKKADCEIKELKKDIEELELTICKVTHKLSAFVNVKTSEKIIFYRLNKIGHQRITKFAV